MSRVLTWGKTGARAVQALGRRQRILWQQFIQGGRLSSAISRNREAADALDAVVKEMLKQ